MNLGVLAVAAKRAETLIANNSPVLLTAAGVTGVLSTAYLAVKGTFQAADILRSARTETKMKEFIEASSTLKEQNEKIDEYVESIKKGDNEDPLDFKTKAELTWKCYIPAGISAIASIAAIVAANRIGTKRATAMATAYSLSEKAFVEYKDRVKEKMGARKEQTLQDEIIQDQVRNTPLPTGRNEIVVVDGNVLCYDTWSGRYFTSSMEKLRKAQNDFNQQVIHDCRESLSYFYELIGLPSNEESDYVGWTTDEMMDLGFSSGIAENGNPYLAIMFNNRPTSWYMKTH